MLFVLLALACAQGTVTIEPLELACSPPANPDADARWLMPSGVFMEPGTLSDVTVWRQHSAPYQEFLARWAEPAPAWEVVTQHYTDDAGELLLECAWSASAQAFSVERFMLVW